MAREHLVCGVSVFVQPHTRAHRFEFLLGSFIMALAGKTFLYSPKCLVFKIILGIKLKKKNFRCAS